VSKNIINQLHTLPVLHFNRCLTTQYSQTTAHCNDNFGTDNQMYVLWSKCTATFRTHCITDNTVNRNCLSQWPRGLRHRSVAARLLRLWVRIPPGPLKTLCSECCVLSGRVMIYMYIYNINGWAIWSGPSPQLQLLSPSFLRSPNCSLSLWTAVVWF
jgi:hypothetical protein